MKPLDLDGPINGRESRGLLCVECGKVIDQGATDACPDQVDIERSRKVARAAHAGQGYSAATITLNVTLPTLCGASSSTSGQRVNMLLQRGCTT